MSIRNIILAAAGGSSLWNLTTKKAPSDLASGDNFGFSVAMSADRSTCAVGAYQDDNAAGTNAGAVYIYSSSGTLWTEQTKLLPPSVCQFGAAVAMSADGSTCAIGAIGDSAGGTSAGAVFVYTRSGSTWSLQLKITAADATAYDYFGRSVALSGNGDTLAIGAVGDDVVGGNSDGSVYIYSRSGGAWGQQAKFRGGTSPANSSFGVSVSLSHDGDTCACGDGDAAYVFTRSGSTWAQQAKLVASDLVSGDGFGSSVSLSSDGNTMAVSSLADDNAAGTNAGAGYIFTRSGSAWTQQAKFIGSLASDNAYANVIDLSSDGNTCVLGSERAVVSGGVAATGLAYIFTRSGSTWSEAAVIPPDDGAANDQFGYAASISGDGLMVVIGAQGAGDGGAIYFVGK